jgi:hypothetical protein
LSEGGTVLAEMTEARDSAFKSGGFFRSFDRLEKPQVRRAGLALQAEILIGGEIQKVHSQPNSARATVRMDT